MTNILLGGLATLLFLAGCESKVQNPSNENIEKSISSTDDTIIETAPPEDKFVYDQDGIIVCEEDETGMCLDDSLQDLRAAQLMERQYVTNASGDQDELGEYGDIADEE